MRTVNLLKYMLVLVAMPLAMVSCEDYLDYDENKKTTEAQVWEKFSSAKQYLTAVYDKMPSGFMSVGGAFLDCSTDNAEHLYQSSSVNKYNLGTWDMFDNPNGDWTELYKGIRLANTFIVHADTMTLAAEQVNMAIRIENLAALRRYRGEARFLKAYFYFELMKRYGQVPIVEDWTDQFTPADKSRKSIEEITEFIAMTCDSAVNYLPELTDLTGNFYKNNLGRIFKGAAYALKSRAYLYAASPLHNPTGAMNAYYDSCAVASAKLFSMGYSLTSGYANLFKPGTTGMQNNKEVILDIRAAKSTSLESNNFPISFYSGKGQTNPTQDLVDAYEMKDGSTFDWNNPAHVAAMYTNRDARFAATIAYNGADMGGRIVETFEGGKDMSTTIADGTRTGYYLRKHLKAEAKLENDNQSATHYWFVFRFAEVLLNYAEAMNELHGPDNDPNAYGKTALQAINMVRKRALQPELPAGMSQEEFRTKLRNERRVELAFEGHRHFDVRRWDIGESTIGQPIHGVKIIRVTDTIANTVTDTYERFQVEERVFKSHMNLYPIPSDEVLMADGIDQNPGW